METDPHLQCHCHKCREIRKLRHALETICEVGDNNAAVQVAKTALGRDRTSYVTKAVITPKV